MSAVTLVAGGIALAGSGTEDGPRFEASVGGVPGSPVPADLLDAVTTTSIQAPVDVGGALPPGGRPNPTGSVSTVIRRVVGPIVAPVAAVPIDGPRTSVPTTPPPLLPAPPPATPCCAGPAPSQPARPMTVKVFTDRDHYAEEEGVVISADVCNATDQDVRFWVYPGQELIFYARHLDRRISASPNTPVAEGRFVTWTPGQCRTYRNRLVWWHDGWAATRPHGFPVVEPGRYEAEATFAAQAPQDSGLAHERDGTSGVSEPFDLDGISVSVTADRSAYAESETVRLTMRACNPTSRAQTQTFRWSPWGEVRVMLPDYTYIMAQVTPNGPVDEPYQATWASGECKVKSYAWNQGETLVEGTDPGPRQGLRREPGRFAVAVLWWGRSLPHEASPSAWRDWRFDELFELT